MNFTPESVRSAASLMQNLYKLFIAKDCSLAEINPLVITEDDKVMALDAKLNFDDSALFRHPEIQALRDETEEIKNVKQLNLGKLCKSLVAMWLVW